jgi:hypothetical protein
VASCGTRNSTVQFEVDAKHLIEPCDLAAQISKLFQSVYNSPCPVVFPIFSLSSAFLLLAPVPDSDVLKLFSA